MDVILIRHAEAGDRDPVRFPDDDLRPVTAEGRKKMAIVARAMKQAGIKFDLLVSSPLVRALQTAEMVREAYEYAALVDTNDALGKECGPEAVVKLLGKFGADHKVALVGHEPAFSAVAAAMISPSGDAKLELKKGGSIGIRFEGHARLGQGTLLFHLKPGQLKKLAR